MSDGSDLSRAVRGHLPSLDGVRGLAILLVLAHNFNIAGLSDHGRIGRVSDLFMDWGWVGVQLFFVLSGFLITGILVDTREAPRYYRSFFARRALRIFPLYYTALLVGLVLLPFIVGHSPSGHEHQLWLWLYLSNWASAFGAGVYGFAPFWSLAVEEQFYLMWPFVVRGLSRRRLLWLCALLVGASLAARVICRAYDVSAEAIYELTFCRFDALAMGAAAAIVLRAPATAAWVERHIVALAGSSAGAFALGGWATRGYPRLTAPTQTIGFLILAWTFVVFVMAAVVSEVNNGRLARALSLRPLRAVGKYSYAMYVIHEPLYVQLARPLLERHVAAPYSMRQSAAFFVVLTAATFVLAMVSYYVLERPFLRLKDRFAIAR